MEKVSLHQLVELLNKKGFMLYIAESCTGGLICSEFVKLEGISSCFGGGVVAYSNEYKIKFLGVSPDTLSMYGAVSGYTAEEMAIGVLLSSDMQDKNYVCLSVTGVAGPGRSERKPVGLVYFGLNINGRVKNFERHFKGSRNEIQQSVYKEAISLIFNCILDEM